MRSKPRLQGWGLKEEQQGKMCCDPKWCVIASQDTVRRSKLLSRCIYSAYGTSQIACKENSALEKFMGGRLQGKYLPSSLLCLLFYWPKLAQWAVSFSSVSWDHFNGSVCQFSCPSLFHSSLKVTKKSKTLNIQLVSKAVTMGDGLTHAGLVPGWNLVVLVGYKWQYNNGDLGAKDLYPIQ